MHVWQDKDYKVAKYVGSSIKPTLSPNASVHTDQDMSRLGILYNQSNLPTIYLDLGTDGVQTKHK